MALGDIFREAAQEVILEFAEELGQSTLHVSDKGTYDPETGGNVEVFVDHLAYMAGDQLVEILQQTATLEYRRELLVDNSLVFIAGDDIPGIVPKVDDVIAPAWSLFRHRISHVDGDIYEALWTCYVKILPE